MEVLFGVKKEKYFELWNLIARNVFLLVNAIIFGVAFFLIYFGSVKEGIFLGVIIFINILMGLAQDIHAWLTLERLHLLTVLKVIKINNDGTTQEVLPAELLKNDRVILHLGDQVPCDALVLSEKSFEVSESLITGESSSFRKEVGNHVLAGSIVTSGTATLEVETEYRESRIAKMTSKIKRYTENLSPIQVDVGRMVKYSGYVLIVIILYVAYLGETEKLSHLSVVKSIGALASTIVPQGLVIATTLLFAYGATHLFRRHVLMQDVNATEKLGRIKNLCMDKTGTLTETTLTVEEMHSPDIISSEEARYLTLTYLSDSGDSSQTVRAIGKFLGKIPGCKVSDVMSFSSVRRYGAISIDIGTRAEAVLAGAPDIFLPHIADKNEKEWLSLLLESHSREGKRLFAVVRSAGAKIPRELGGSKLSVVAVFVLNNNLRQGIRETIDFFQKRGVKIRIISGDSPDTVRAIASLAGVRNPEKYIIGANMESWDENDFANEAKRYTIFARILPEQKEKLVKAFKKDGFTAMVGDGANDALAIKKADLGIAMFDGAPATRQLASVVLTNNSFTELPGGVRLADRIIKNIEIFAAIFFNQTFVGFFLFLWISILGFLYPLTPLNVTLTNYFTIGLPGILVSIWAMQAKENLMRENMDSFLKRVLPFPFVAAMIQSFCLMAIYIMNNKLLPEDSLRTLMVVSLSIVGFAFFLFAPQVYEKNTTLLQRKQFIFLGMAEILILGAIFKWSVLSDFFNITAFPMQSVESMLIFTGISTITIFVFVRSFFPNKEAIS